MRDGPQLGDLFDRAVELLLSRTGRAAPARDRRLAGLPLAWPATAGPSDVPHLSSSRCRSAQAVAHFVGKVHYRRAAAIQHTVETPP